MPATELCYVCSNGHTTNSPHPITRCPVVRKGSPCKGDLKRTGPGSRRSQANDPRTKDTP